MKLPNPPDTDEEIQRHKFYGSIVSSLECLEEKLKNDEENYNSHIKLDNDRYERVKRLIENVNIRTNKRTYQNDFETLDKKVTKLNENDIAHKTAWATGKIFIIGAWAVFTTLSLWGYSLTLNKVNEYVTQIEENKKEIIALNAIRKDYETHIIESKANHKYIVETIETLKSSTTYNKQKLADNWKSINRLQKK